MSDIDWSKAGKRIRHQDRDAWGKNPDWDWANKRWKDEADYYAEELLWNEVYDLAECLNCGAEIGRPCSPLYGYSAVCTPRRRAAGEGMLAERGPRFS